MCARGSKEKKPPKGLSSREEAEICLALLLYALDVDVDHTADEGTHTGISLISSVIV